MKRETPTAFKEKREVKKERCPGKAAKKVMIAAAAMFIMLAATAFLVPAASDDPVSFDNGDRTILAAGSYEYRIIDGTSAGTFTAQESVGMNVWSDLIGYGIGVDGSIQDAVNAIRMDTANTDCEITFWGDGSLTAYDMLDIGSAGMSFDNKMISGSKHPDWGMITLHGAVTSSAPFNNYTIFVDEYVAIISDAHIICTDTGVAILGNTNEEIKITGGTVENTYSGSLYTAVGIAIQNGYAGTVTVTGGTVQCTAGRAIVNDTGGSVDIYSGTVKSSGTVVTVANMGDGKINVYGGTVENDHPVDVYGGPAIYTGSGKVTISEDTSEPTLVAAKSNSAVFIGPTAGSNVRLEITGGIVQSESNSFDTILNASEGNIEIKGGIVRNTGTGTAIAGSSTGEILISGTPLITSKSPTATIFLFVLSDTPGDRLTVSGGTIQNTGSGSAIYNDSMGNIAIEGGTVRNTGTGHAITNLNYMTMIDISAGTVSSVSGYAINYNITNTSPGKITISGTALVTSGGARTISLTCTPGSDLIERLAITGGTVENTAAAGTAYAIYNGMPARISISGTASVTSDTAADTATILITNTATGSGLTISGGKVEKTSTGPAITNESDGSVTVSGGTVVNLNGRTIYNTGSGTVTIIGDAEVYSKSFAGYAVRCDSPAGTVILGGDPEVGTIWVYAGTLSVITGGSINDLVPTHTYTVRIEDAAIGAVAVKDGTGLVNSFAYYNGDYVLFDNGTDLILATPGYQYRIIDGTSDYTAERYIGNMLGVDVWVPVVAGADVSLQDAADAIKADADGNDCSITFWGNDTLDIGDPGFGLTVSAGITFDGGASEDEWGTITLHGVITSSASAGMIVLENGVSIISDAEMQNTAGVAVINLSSGTVTVSSGTVSGAAAAIENKSSGTVNVKNGTVTGIGYGIYNTDGAGTINVTGGTVSATGAAGIAIVYYPMSNTGAGYISISGTALVTSGGDYTIYIKEVSDSGNPAVDRLYISGGTVSNTASTGSGHAIYAMMPAKITISAGATVRSSSNAGSDPNGTIYLIDDAELSMTGGTVQNTGDGYALYTRGTVTLSGGTVSSAGSRAMINGGTMTITGTASVSALKHAVVCSADGNVILGGSPTIGGVINVHAGKLSVSTGGAVSAFVPGAKTYNVAIVDPSDGAVAVVNGGSTEADVLDNFILDNTGWVLSDDGTDLVLIEPAGEYRIIYGTAAGTFTAQRLDAHGDWFTFNTSIGQNNTLSNVIEAIMASADGDDCSITFWGDDSLDIGDPGFGLDTVSQNALFDNWTLPVGWGTITLHGVITSASPASTITLWHDVSVISDAVIENTGTGAAIFNLSDGSITMNGGIVSAETNAIQNMSAGSITINGGTVSGGVSAIYNFGAGNVTITGGTVSSTDGNAISVRGNDAVINVTGGTVSSANGTAIDYDLTSNAGTGYITISGTATVTSGGQYTINMSSAAGGTAIGRLFISGGTVSNTASNGIAIYGNMPADISISGTANITSASSFAAIHMMYYMLGGELTISSGTVSNTGSGAAIDINSAGAVTITGGTLSSTGAFETITVRSGTVTIKGDAVITAAASAYALFCYSDDGTVVLGGDPSIGRPMYVYAGKLSVIVGGSPDDLTPSGTYTIELHNPSAGAVAVVDGAPFLLNFVLDSDDYGLKVGIGANADDLVLAVKYTVTFVYNDGATPDATQKVIDNDKVIEPTAPTRPNWVFGGWLSDTMFATAWDFSVDVVTDDITLYALWNEAPGVTYFTVTFDPMNGSAAFTQKVAENDKVIEPSEPVRDNWIFGGWFSDMTFATEWDFSVDVVTDDITLYALWNEDPGVTYYTVTFVTNGGTAVAAQKVAEGDLLLPVSTSRTNWDFGGWFSDEALTTVFMIASDPVNGDMTLYALWNEDPGVTYFIVTFDPMNGSSAFTQKVAENDKIIEPSEPVRDNWVFGGWFTDISFATEWDFSVDLVTGDMTLYALWDEDPGVTYYTVTFVTNGGTAVATQKVAEGDPILPVSTTRANWDFGGWFSDDDLTTSWNVSDPVTEDMTLYALWNEMSGITYYTVTFVTNGGSAVAAQKVAEGDLLLPVSTSRTNWDFGGWFSDETLTTVFMIASDPVNDNITLYAKWDEKTGVTYYTVTFVTNGGTAVATQKVAEGDLLLPVSTSRSGWVFGGWFSDDGLTASWDVSDPVMSDMTLYALWNDPADVTSKLVSGDGNGSMGAWALLLALLALALLFFMVWLRVRPAVIGIVLAYGRPSVSVAIEYTVNGRSGKVMTNYAGSYRITAPVGSEIVITSVGGRPLAEKISVVTEERVTRMNINL